MSKTIEQSGEELHQALCEYIEATYHIADPALLAARRRLMNHVGNVHQAPFLESTPKYTSGRAFEQLGLPTAAASLLAQLATKDTQGHQLLHNPPYRHQADALTASVVDGHNLLIMTGTGSGKTESFLMPIMAKLAIEAQSRPDAFRVPAVRAFLLYPMNALVNDQLGRLRSLLGDPRLLAQFEQWAGRVPTFARYTSRTPYAGVRDKKKDGKKLKSLEDFYVALELAAEARSGSEGEGAWALRQELKARGKWPAKPSMSAWLGKSGSDWQRRGTGEFIRAVARRGDSELVTRHEVQAQPPDVLITNYSMLEYMLMRPIERTIFDSTRTWLADNPDERLTIVLDEAHLYRGAAGAEVGLLLRRLRDRLDVGADRIQAICATASFHDRNYAAEFGAQLSGCPAATFVPIEGELNKQKDEAVGSLDDALALAAVDLDALYEAPTQAQGFEAVTPFLAFREVSPQSSVDAALFEALHSYPPLTLLVNFTMGAAQPSASLASRVFPQVPAPLAERAVSTLLALGSRARAVSGAGLLPCRLHVFFRGLPGLWVCMDPTCTAIDEAERNDYCGKMYAQPRNRCECDACCLEFYTCRNCGGAYARAYTDNVDEPSALWSEPGLDVSMPGGLGTPLEVLDLLLTPPTEAEDADPANYDVETGRLNPYTLGPRTRKVYLRADRAPSIKASGGTPTESPRGAFLPCGLCQQPERSEKSSVQDHMTKGDQPFQALVSRQIQIQPPGPLVNADFAPLRGRKVLVFSDSRQVAARLAPNLQNYSMRDALRPLLIWGTRALQRSERVKRATLDDAYFATLLAAKALKVRLRPEVQAQESFAVFDKIGAAVTAGALHDDDRLFDCWEEYHEFAPPSALLEELAKTISDRYTGLEALALASWVERPHRRAALLERLPPIPTLAEDQAARLAVVHLWLRCWKSKGVCFQGMPATWWGTRVQGHSGKFRAMNRVLGTSGRKTFEATWLPVLLEEFTESMGDSHRLLARTLTLQLEGPWVRCETCTSVHRPLPTFDRCIDCGRAVVALDADADPVFTARKGYYRRSAVAVLSESQEVPLSLVAAEHTAQLGAAQNDEAFSKAEENELLFQDIDISWRADAKPVPAIDILSSTTTMEVGIDIGALSGVALRNMPPGRANYQQRAGRAGRRGNAVATVVAFGSVDSHDEHYFSHPTEMISGDVVDPRLTLDNLDIARRHVRAFLLQRYHQARLPQFSSSQPADLFSVLGKVGHFRNGTGLLNRADFAAWLQTSSDDLKRRVRDWMPEELSSADGDALVEGMIEDCLQHVDAAVAFIPDLTSVPDSVSVEEAVTDPDLERPVDHRSDQDTLLDRLLYEGVLPRYAFPTDVATFHVFDTNRSKPFKPVTAFTPSQGLPIALSQYAPGKQVWIAGKCYTSGAIYSPSNQERRDAWAARRIYFECSTCAFAWTRSAGVSVGEVLDCPACKAQGTFGPGRAWLRPVGFAHPVDVPEETSPDNVPETSYATRAKLTMSTPEDGAQWQRATERVRGLSQRTKLLVSNSGPKDEGYTYCCNCGRIEAQTEPLPTLGAPHRRPYPANPGQSICPGFTAQHVVLGTDFVTDIALFSVQVTEPVRLPPVSYATHIALRTLSEAMARVAGQMLSLEPGEVLAEFRPSVVVDEQQRSAAEIFIYDTLPGGAGFATQIPSRGLELLAGAHKFLVGCPEQCDSSCYRCLRTFGNKFEHRALDRHVGAELAAHLLTGASPQFSPERAKASTRLLYEDLSRLEDSDYSYSFNGAITTPGTGELQVPILAIQRASGRCVAIGVSSALTPDFPADESLRTLLALDSDISVIVVDELLIRVNLPSATSGVRSRLRSKP